MGETYPRGTGCWWIPVSRLSPRSSPTHLPNLLPTGGATLLDGRSGIRLAGPVATVSVPMGSVGELSQCGKALLRGPLLQFARHLFHRARIGERGGAHLDR